MTVHSGLRPCSDGVHFFLMSLAQSRAHLVLCRTVRLLLVSKMVVFLQILCRIPYWVVYASEKVVPRNKPGYRLLLDENMCWSYSYLHQKSTTLYWIQLLYDVLVLRSSAEKTVNCGPLTLDLTQELYSTYHYNYSYKPIFPNSL